MNVLVPVLVVLALLLANAACVAAEFALVATSRAALEARAARGSRRARHLLPFATEPKLQARLLAATQLGVTLASLSLGMYGEHRFAQFMHGELAWFRDGSFPDSVAFLGGHALASGLALFVLTGLHIVLGEMVPKVIALERAEPVLMFLAPPLLAFARILSPFVLVLQAAGSAVLLLFRIRPGSMGERLHTAADLQAMIHESQESGLIRGETGAVARRLFEFGDRTAAEVMVPREKIVAIPMGAKPAEIRKLLKESRHTRFVVYEGDIDRVLGQVHAKDLLRLILASAALQKNDVRKLPAIPTSLPLDRVIASLQAHRAQMALVATPEGRTAGLIALGDLSDEVIGPILERRFAGR